jgi:hypothetical protein
MLAEKDFDDFSVMFQKLYPVHRTTNSLCKIECAVFLVDVSRLLLSVDRFDVVSKKRHSNFVLRESFTFGEIICLEKCMLAISILTATCTKKIHRK